MIDRRTRIKRILSVILIASAVVICAWGLAAYAGPYAGMTYSVDNDRGFCNKNNFDDYCQSGRAFVGYDGELGDGWGYDANASYETQLDGNGLLDPTRGSVTVYKRW